MAVKKFITSEVPYGYVQYKEKQLDRGVRVTISMLFVDEEWRGQGRGNKLLEVFLWTMMYKHKDAGGCLFTLFPAGNDDFTTEALEAWYLRLGFTPVAGKPFDLELDLRSRG